MYVYEQWSWNKIDVGGHLEIFHSDTRIINRFYKSASGCTERLNLLHNSWRTTQLEN